MTDTGGLTADEQAQLDALQQKAAEARWQEAEAARTARLATFAAIADKITTAKVGELIGAIEQAARALGPGDRDAYQRLDRMAAILRYDALAIAQLIEALSTPTPQPGTPAAPATGA